MNDRKAKQMAIRRLVRARRKNASQVCTTCGWIAAHLSSTAIKPVFGQWSGQCDVCGEVRTCGADRDFGYPDFSRVSATEARRINKALDDHRPNGFGAWRQALQQYLRTLSP